MVKKRKPYKRNRWPLVHEGYSLVKPVAVRKYLTAIRVELVADLGGEENISCQQKLIVDAIINLLGITRSIEEHIRENAVMTGANLAPALRTSYLAYRNSIQRHLVVLGINKKADEIVDPVEYIQSQGDKDDKA